MAYMREGYLIIRAKGSNRELIIDEFDEDGVEIETAEDKTTRRMTTRGKTLYAITKNVPYELTISIKPDTSTLSRALEFMKFLKQNNYPELEFETYETIDTKSVVTKYIDGNILSELDSEAAFSTDVPKFTLKIAGTREDKQIA